MSCVVVPTGPQPNFTRTVLCPRHLEHAARASSGGGKRGVKRRKKRGHREDVDVRSSSEEESSTDEVSGLCVGRVWGVSWSAGTYFCSHRPTRRAHGSVRFA